ncbi:MAG: hypothetical protein CLLPBCKN_005827 [Chroococcidiopsis cubana SAG 39.79]|nr:hypothetical protein [Chroococcidiopsis cubana]MDZ4876407.1 hypothetical protein [Chroococcidiopsis cubana SAG 39.79]
MTNEIGNQEDNSVRIEIIPQDSSALVDEQMPGESDEIKTKPKP